MNSPDISAVICSYNRYDCLPDAIDSLDRQNLARESYEILVIDNSPDHEYSSSFARRYAEHPNLTWIIEHTPGLSNARNAAIQRARGRIIAYMDDDALADVNWLGGIFSAFAMFGDRTAVVGGKVEPIWESTRPAWLHDDYLRHLSLVDLKGSMPRVLGTAESLAGTNIAFRTDRLKETGGFSTDLGRKGGSHALLSNEENEVCRILRRSGHSVVYAPDAVVGHRIGAARLTQEWFRRRVAWQAVSDYLRDGAKLFDESPAYWNEVLQFANLLPPRDRTLRALYVPQTDPEMFRMEMTALYNYTVALLTGFAGIP